MSKNPSPVSVNSSASNCQSIAFSKLCENDENGENYFFRLFNIKIEDVFKNICKIDKMFVPEKETPPELLENVYLALVDVITSQGYPIPWTSEAERASLIQATLTVSSHFLCYKEKVNFYIFFFSKGARPVLRETL